MFVFGKGIYGIRGDNDEYWLENNISSPNLFLMMMIGIFEPTSDRDARSTFGLIKKKNRTPKNNTLLLYSLQLATITR